jgi:hypothetical protein
LQLLIVSASLGSPGKNTEKENSEKMWVEECQKSERVGRVSSG